MSVKTPCIGICSTGIGDVVCRGCKRFAREVIDWNQYSDEQKQLIVDRIDGFLATILPDKVEIFNQVRLFECLQLQHIHLCPTRSPYRWLYELLRAGAAQIDQPQDYGFRIRSDWQRFSVEELKQFIEQDFFALSCAHYERYVAGAYRLGGENGP